MIFALAWRVCRPSTATIGVTLMADAPARIATPAEISNAKIEQSIANANAQMERLKVEFRDSPSERLARDRAELERMSNDINFQNALASDNQGAKNQLTSVRARIATAEREIEKLTSLDRVDAAFKGDPAPDSLVDTKTGDDLGRRDLRTVVTDGKAKGTPTPIIQEQLLPNQNDPRVIAEARRQLEQLVTDPEWQAKISRG